MKLEKKEIVKDDAYECFMLETIFINYILNCCPLFHLHCNHPTSDTIMVCQDLLKPFNGFHLHFE